MPNYTLAGCETLANYVRLQDYLETDEVSNFLDKYCRHFLHSFGQDFDGRYDNHVQHEVNTTLACRKLYKNSELIYDSGGFQISINKVERKHIRKFMEIYYDNFLLNHHKLIDKAFIMDMPPGPNCEVFTDFNDVFDWNLESYLIASKLPQHIRDKIVYIHHFRTPELWKIYTKILRENDMFNMFQFHGTGGLVANQASDTQTPQMLLVFPLIQLLNETKKYNRTSLDYHVLGNATFRDVLFYHVFELHVKKIHGIDLTIGFDSSGLYKGIMKGRHIQVIDDDYRVVKIDLRENMLDKRCQRSISYREKFKRCVSKMCAESGLQEPPEELLHNIYYWQEKKRKNGTVRRTRTFHPVIRLYIALCYLYNYSKANTILRPAAEDLYSLYESQKIREFNTELTNTTRAVNFGKITRKQKKKAEGLVGTLGLLESLNEDHCEWLVKKYLGKDEFTLDDKRKVLII